MRNKSTNASAFSEGLKSLFRGLLKVISVLISWGFKLIAVSGKKLGELFEKLGNK